MTDETVNTDEVNEETGEHQQAAGEPSGEDRDYEAEAREMGWKPKEEWNGDPEHWRDAREFVKRGEEFLPYVRAERDRLKRDMERKDKDFEERLKRLDQANRAALERQKKQYEAQLADLEAREEKAVEDGDKEAYQAVKRQRENLGPPPEVPEQVSDDQAHQPSEEVNKWAEGNSWFYTDPAMRSLAIGVAGKVAEAGGDVKAQLKAAEEEVQRRFPERFGNGQQQPRQIVEGGGQPTGKRKQPKGVGNLPREARDGFKELVRMGIYSDSNEDLAKYAKDYWEQEA